MPIIKSAKKRVRTAEKAAIANSKTRKSVRKSVKALQHAIDSNDTKSLSKLFVEAQASIDTAVKKNVMHKKKAARKKSQLSNKVKSAGGKISTKAAAAKKTATDTKAKSTKKANSTKPKTTTKKPANK